MKTKTKIKCLGILAVLLVFVLYIRTEPTEVLAAESGEIIYIDTAEDLLTLAENCALDTWSHGKEVILREDISLEGTEFLPIPTFGGTFDGNGHRITGIESDGKTVPSGLFGILQEEAVVKNLHVGGKLLVTDENVGGIAGINNGLIFDCSFDGTVSGGSNVGGIAGVNGANGKIQNCRVSGGIQGGSMTGGVAGSNKGTISSCTNRGNVNIESVDPGLDTNELDFGLSVNILRIGSLDTVNVATDTGGIAGYSSGMILSCTNQGTVGYRHIGYNVGGIAGRSCGYLFECKNQGEVFGRKDIGGIVGQAEPDILLNLSADNLAQIREELNRLEELVSLTTEHAAASSSRVSSQLSEISTGIDAASGYAKSLTGEITEYGGSVVEEVNRSGAVLSDVIEQIAQSGSKLSEVSANMTQGILLLEQSVRELAQSGEFAEDAMRKLQEAADDLIAANGLLESGMGKITDGLGKLREAVLVKDGAAVSEALRQIEAGSRELAGAADSLGKAMAKLSDALESQNTAPGEVIAILRELGSIFTNASSAVFRIADGMSKLQENITADLNLTGDGLALLLDGMQVFGQIPGQISQATEHLKSALDSMTQASEGLRQGLGTFAGALAVFGEASDGITTVISEMSAALSGLQGAKPVQIAYPSETTGNLTNALYDSLGEMNGRIRQLNTEMSASSEVLAADLQKLNSQFMTVMNLFLDMVYQAESSSGEERISDTSQEDIDAVINGKVLSCRNGAAIYGDINVGGVAGSLAVEYEFDPEDDLLAGDAASYRREYELKAILQKCVNDAAVTGRRDYVGGICGKMDLGLAVFCEGYGSAESENGDYVGGISGISVGTIRNCYAKCSLSGRKYIGGITGSGGSHDAGADGAKVANCYSMVRILSYEQHAGAVSGIDMGEFANNYFVSDSLAGLGRCSISGCAEPLSYDALLETEGLPEAFRTFVARFLVDGTLLEQRSFAYGGEIAEADFPGIPEKEGYFSAWSAEELKDLHFDVDVEAVYTPYETVLASGEIRADGREIFFVEGLFDDEGRLSAKRITEEADEGGLSRGKEAEERWELRIPEDGAKVHRVRYLPCDGETKKRSVWLYQDGAWTKADAQTVGSYLVFEAPGNEVLVTVAK